MKDVMYKCRFAILTIGGLAVFTSMISHSGAADFWLIGGSDAYISIVRLSALALTALVGFIVVATVAASRWPESFGAKLVFAVALFLWALSGRAISFSSTSGEIQGYWYFIRTDSVLLRPSLVDVDDYIRDAELCRRGWVLEISFRQEHAERLWIGPIISTSAESFFRDAGFRCLRKSS